MIVCEPTPKSAAAYAHSDVECPTQPSATILFHPGALIALIELLPLLSIDVAEANRDPVGEVKHHTHVVLDQHDPRTSQASGARE